MSRKRGTRLPEGAFEAALKRAAEYQAANKEILSYGIGFKYSDEHGYGRTSRPCIKFVVNSKAPESQREHRKQFIPKSITIKDIGRTWRLPTDVVEARTAVQHLLRVRPDDYPAGQGFGGTPGFVAHDGTAAPPFLITAGHALQANGNGVVDGQEVLLDPLGSLGTVIEGVTYQRQPEGLHDFGAVRCAQNSPALEFYYSTPWACIRSVVDVQAIKEMVKNKEHPLCGVLGAATVALARFDGRLHTGMTFAFPGASVSYAPGLLLFRAVDGGFAPGDSGAAIVLGNGVVGLHVVGITAEPTLSYAVHAASALDAIARHTSRPLKVRW